MPVNLAQIPEMQRLSYDLSPLQELGVPIIWLLGSPGTNRDVQAQIIEETYGFEIIKVSDLLRKHSSNETDRGRVIKENIDRKHGYIPDAIIIDLIKEDMLSRVRWANGYVLNGFPRSKSQGNMFVKEIIDVDVVIVMYGKVDKMVNNLLVNGDKMDVEFLKKNIVKYVKNINTTVRGFGAKTEKFDTTKANTDQVFARIQSALNVRVFSEDVQRANEL